MHQFSAKPDWHSIDGQKVYTASQMEARIIRRLVKNGFSGRWRRTRTGISHGYSNYTPDLELSVEHEGQTVRALVELKPLRKTDFKLADRRRMCGIARHYPATVLLLCVEKTNKWYEIDKKTAAFIDSSEPTPGRLPIDKLPRSPLTIPIFNKYARVYSVKPLNLSGKLLANGLEFFVQAIFGPKKKRRNYRK